MVERQLAISVVICAYTEDRWNDLKAAIESIQNQTLPASELILVIDHNPALLSRARAAFPGITFVENTEPRGLSGARNCGIAVAGGDLIAFLDDDAIVEPGWLASLQQRCQDAQVLGVGGLIVPSWPDSRPTWFPQEFYWVIGCSYQHFQGKITRVRNTFGANMCIRREVFEAVGGFRTDMGRLGTKQLPLGGEETELCIRAQQHWPDRFFLYDPHAIAHHSIAPQRINKRYFCGRCYAEGLSKAALALYTGSKDALASERAYAFRLLPRGIIRGVLDGFRGNIAGFTRAWMIGVGLIATTFGYFLGTISYKIHLRTSGTIEHVPPILQERKMTSIQENGSGEVSDVSWKDA